MDILKSFGTVAEVIGKTTVVVAAATYVVKELGPVVAALLETKSGS